MGQEIHLAGITFSADDWSEYDETTRRDLLAAAADDDGDSFDDEPTAVYSSPSSRSLFRKVG